MTNTRTHDKLSVVMKDGQWNWPMITDIACLEITYMLPPISEGQDRISWKSNDGSFKTSTAYDLFRQRVQGCLVFTFGRSFQDPKNNFILWLAIMGKLSTLDKPWLHHTDSNCILCTDGAPETHDHLFFTCSFSRRCLTIIRQQIPFLWPHRHWQRGIHWASSRWRGKHVVNAAFRSLLASLVYHICRNAIRDDSSNVVGHPRLWEISWLKRSDKGSLAFNYGKLLAHLVCTDYGKSLGLSRGYPTDLFVLFVLLH
ncbi:UNVERIFIED_CONTAM: hypothetical protein Sangu_2636900 [Sesamum angustifolium]|uniref:Reverse transcriptase zinc-binding domain-containing protein n=1 Tax=Sesamum angustifolium TaxID=2727405 RepID=A0AAW2J462_9LAMI